MAKRPALSRLFALRRPTPVSPIEQVEDPTDYSRRLKKITLTANPKTPFFKTAGWERPTVDFRVLRNACRTEPLFSRRNDRYQNLCWKNGYALKTDDEEAKEYVQSRMEVYAVLNGETFDSFLRQATFELIEFNNLLILEKRRPVRELRKMGINLPIKGTGPLANKGPVVGYEVIPMDTVQYERDKFGNVVKWRQVGLDGNTKNFSPDEVILITIGKESGDILAHPALERVLIDARILRQLETDASLVGHRLAFPIFKYKCGDPKVPETLPKKGQLLDDVWNALENMLSDGTLIMPGYDDFDVVLADAKMDGLHQVMAYFKDRVVSGMGLSQLHLGDPSSANRSVADRLDVQLYDDVKAYQKPMMETINFSMFGKWLLEGGFNLRFGEVGESDSRVELSFNEIDTDSMIKKENQACALWVQDLITLPEARERLGYTPLAEEQMEFLYSALIGNITNQQAMDLARVGAAATAAASPSKSTAQKTRGGGKQRSNAKTRATKTSSFEDEDNLFEVAITDFMWLVRQVSESAYGEYSMSGVNKSWSMLEEEVSSYIARRFPTPDRARQFEASDLTFLQILFKEELEEELRNSIVLHLRSGLDRGFEEARSLDPNVAPMRMSTFNQHVNTVLDSLDSYLEKLIVDLFKRVEDEIQKVDNPATGVEDAFLALHYRLEQVVSTHNAIASNWGVAIAAEHAGYDYVWQESQSTCRICKSGWVPTKDMKLENVPPFSTHPHCGCRVHVRI